MKFNFLRYNQKSQKFIRILNTKTNYLSIFSKEKYTFTIKYFFILTRERMTALYYLKINTGRKMQQPRCLLNSEMKSRNWTEIAVWSLYTGFFLVHFFQPSTGVT